MPKNTDVAPELPADSIDFNALHDACLAGASPEEALAAGLGNAPAAPAKESEPAPVAEAAPAKRDS